MSTVTQQSSEVTVKSVSFGGVLSSEWIKFLSLRSTWWTLGTMIIFSLGLSALGATVLSDNLGVDLPSTSHVHFAVSNATSGIAFAGLIAAVLGVLLISGEYSTGMIRSTFTAVPKRTQALVAKAIILFAVLVVSGAVIIFGGFLLTVAVFESHGFAVSLADDGVLAALLGGVVYLALIGVMSYGLGAIVRNTAAGISLSVGILLVVPVLLGFLAQVSDWVEVLVAWLPSSVGNVISTLPIEMVDSSAARMEYWQALLIMIGWALVTVIPALVLIKRRDV
ncbi:ABC transporter permease subunit [Lysinibacter sp. HNR]|uniref:ABC transporter permease n=1 Tax=Lysinibacter sp. HNR TaxID=3031408 RepID=UPI002434F6C1|nr:ABC transporter permease subunit [Lysinibacter sp. HNR]WGD37838.1 ABC transporter permease subunit [Lysinibacter sp. HNR]